jgi:nitrogen fixation protein NifB
MGPSDSSRTISIVEAGREGAATSQVDRSRFLERHPCFSEPGSAGGAHLKYGRIHLPVSPRCNLGCLFCARGLRPVNDVPGVASCVLSPEEAIATLDKALEICPDISVVGVAGPGDSLVGDEAIRTLYLAKAKYPRLLACLSTNGLLLRDKAKTLAGIPIDSITVTVNSLVPETLSRINARVVLGGRAQVGLEAARALIEAQRAGIAAAARATKAIIKINTVLIPGLNEGEIGTIAAECAALGASVMNILPLIPQAGMARRRAPSCEELEAARKSASAHLDIFRHCRHCRADAAGIMGKNQDISRLLYGEAARVSEAEAFSHG